MALATVAKVAGAAAGAAYLNAKYHLVHDWNTTGSLYHASKRTQDFIAKKQAEDRLLMYQLLEDNATGPRKNLLFLEVEGGRTWTYSQFYQDVQFVADWLMNDLGIQKNEIVCLDGPNTAEWVLLWFAIDGIGAIPSYLNNHLTGTALVHCVKLVESRVLLADEEMRDMVEPCQKEITDGGCETVYYSQSIIEALRSRAGAHIPTDRTTGHHADDMRALMYTSGTTGLPKAVTLGAGRLVNTARNMGDYLKLKPGDKFYTCLPLYHAAAHSLCVEPVLWGGAAVYLGKRFSHKSFWPEVSASGATRLQYVGELARYLINGKPHPLERQHKLEEAWGNGMRPDVWEPFRQRFGIPVIHELFAASDGLMATFSRNRGDFTRGTIALRGALWKLQMGRSEVRGKIDPDTEELMRDPKTGFVIKCQPGEAGETLIAIPENIRRQMYKGYYRNNAATEKRWIADVFKKGDVWFRVGDVMRMDKDGRLYFVDRLGDTFRWHSENVSTNEVADILGTHDQIEECTVYGVMVPKSDGRAGCATVTLRPGMGPETLDLHGLAQHVLTRLPRYAVPLFIRVTPQLAYTGNYKIQKGQAKREGVDIDLIQKSGSKDTLFWLPPQSQSYVPYSRENWEQLQSGEVKL